MNRITRSDGQVNLWPRTNRSMDRVRTYRQMDLWPRANRQMHLRTGSDGPVGWRRRADWQVGCDVGTCRLMVARLTMGRIGRIYEVITRTDRQMDRSWRIMTVRTGREVQGTGREVASVGPSREVN